jgi:RNA polymerase sigma factor (sigma-70 family)
MRGRALPHYGKLGVANLNREAYQIWLTRNDELPDLEPSQTPWQADNDELQQLMMRDLAQKLLDSLRLNESQCVVLMHRILDEWTLREVAQELGVTVERVRQIENVILRKLRRSFREMTGIDCYYWDTLAAASFGLGDA